MLNPPKDHDIVFNTTGRGVYFGEKEVKKEQSRLSQAINSGQIANTPVNKRLECYKTYDKLQEKSKGTMEYWKTDMEKMKETTLAAVWRISRDEAVKLMLERGVRRVTGIAALLNEMRAQELIVGASVEYNCLVAIIH